MRRCLLVVVAASGLLAVPATAFVGPESKRGDLDGDGQNETVRSVRIDVKGVESMFDPTQIRIEDTCKGKPVRRYVTGRQDSLVKLRLKRIDTHEGLDVFADLRSGAAARQGETDIVAWRGCRAHRLFRYRSTHPTAKPKGTTGEVGPFDVRVRNYAKRYRGLEVRLAEGFLSKGEAECCPSTKKVTYWRYSAKRDRYIRYSTKLTRR